MEVFIRSSGHRSFRREFPPILVQSFLSFGTSATVDPRFIRGLCMFGKRRSLLGGALVIAPLALILGSCGLPQPVETKGLQIGGEIEVVGTVRYSSGTNQGNSIYLTPDQTKKPTLHFELPEPPVGEARMVFTGSGFEFRAIEFNPIPGSVQTYRGKMSWIGSRKDGISVIVAGKEHDTEYWMNYSGLTCEVAAVQKKVVAWRCDRPTKG